MTNISELLNRHRGLTFPGHSEDDVLDEMLLELSEYDGHLAGIASSVAAGQKLRPGSLASDDGLLRRIVARMDAIAFPESERAPIEAYVQSLEHLRSALERAEP